MREVATKGMPSADVLDAVFFADEKHSIPGEVSIRFKRKTFETPVRGSGERRIVTEMPVAEGTPIQSVDDLLEQRKRNSFQMVAEGTPHSQVTPLPAHIEPIEQATAQLSPELLETLARKESAPEARQPRRVGRSIAVGAAVGVLAAVAVILAQYL